MGEILAKLQSGDLTVLFEENKLTVKKNGLSITITDDELKDIGKQIGVLSEDLRESNEEMMIRLFGER